MRTVVVILVVLAFAISAASAATIPIKLSNMGAYDWTKVAVNRIGRTASVSEKTGYGVPPANCFMFTPEKSGT